MHITQSFSSEQIGTKRPTCIVGAAAAVFGVVKLADFAQKEYSILLPTCPHLRTWNSQTT